MKLRHQLKQPLNTLSTMCSYIEILIDQEKIDKEEIKNTLKKAQNQIIKLSNALDKIKELDDK